MIGQSTVGPGSRHTYLPALDGLRAVAVMSVLLAHVGYYIAPGGYIGVDVFFVLSGFLITRILVAEYGRTGNIELRVFYLRRALRLYPALVIAVLLALVTISYSYDGSISRWGKEALLSVTYLMDIGRSVGQPPIADAGPLGINWTLAVEEHFYLIWPILLTTLLRAGGRARAARAALVIALVSWAALMLFTIAGADPDLLYFRPDLRCGGMFLGCALALLIDRVPARFFRMTTVPSAVVLLALIQVAQSNTGLLSWGLRLPATWIVSLILVGAIAHGASGVVGSLLAFRPIRYIGQISYGIYAYHLIIIVTLGQMDLPLSARLLASVALPVGFAALSYHTIEKRFLDLKDRVGRSKSSKT